METLKSYFVRIVHVLADSQKPVSCGGGDELPFVRACLLRGRVFRGGVARA
jgi:hypothetical protein